MHDTMEVLAMRYAFITNRALRAIASAREGRPMSSASAEAIELAAKILLEMRRGTAFALGTQGQLGYSAESIPAATRALSVIEHLALVSHVSQVQTLLERFESNLQALVRADAQPSSHDLADLERFFRALNKTLTEEVSQATLGRALENSENVST